MNHNDWGYAWVAIIVAFIVLRGLFRMIRGLTTGGGGQMDRISAAAKRVLQEQQGRTSVPVTQAKGGIGSGAKAKSHSVRGAASAQKQQTQSASLLAKNRMPAVVRTGLLSGGKEPVIQRRR